MKIRMMYPLVNIIACIITLVMVWGFTRSNATITDNFLEYTIHPVGIIAWFCLIAFIIAVAIAAKIYNKKNPHNKVSLFSITPPEYNEEDEMYQYATMKATRKVYTFITFALPIGFIVPMILPLPISKFTVCVIAVGIIIIQNLIFYFEMRKFKDDTVR